MWTSDYITIHVPLNDRTRGMLNAERFARMKRGVKILNFSRGGLVNNSDLRVAIEGGIVDRYVTDFPDDSLLKLENVIPIPHLGASTPEAEENCAVMAARQLLDFFETGYYLELGQLSELRDAADNGYPYRDRQPQYPQYGRPDNHRPRPRSR